MNWFFCSNLLALPHVILHAGLARSCRIHCSTSGGKPSLSGEDTYQTDEGWEKVFLSGPHPLFAMVHLSRRARIIFWEDGFCDFAFGSAQNDRSEAYCEG